MIDVHDAVLRADGAPGLVRVSVTSAARRVDLALPGTVPVAELVPELARSVGLLDAGTASGGYRVLTVDGRRLEPGLGLTLQGVADGAVLTLVAASDDPAPVVYDDVVEAMADAVERDLAPWRPAAARRTALAGAALLLALGGLALALADDRPAGITAAVVAALLLVGAVVLSRALRTADAAVTAAWLAAGYAAVAGHLLTSGTITRVFTDSSPAMTSTLTLTTTDPARPMVATGAAAALVGLVALLALGRGRVLVAPVLVVGVVWAVAGLVGLARDVGLTGDDGVPGERTAVTLVVLLVVAVLAGSVLPWVAVTSAGASRWSAAEGPTEPVDAARVTADARLGHEVQLAVTATVGLLLVVTGPVAVGLGLGGALLALDAALVVMLRTRQHRSSVEVGLGLGVGLTGLAVAAVAAVLTQDAWRLPGAVAAVVLGGSLLATTLVSRPGVTSAAVALRRGRLGDALETLALVLLLPLLVWATGLLDVVATAAERL